MRDKNEEIETVEDKPRKKKRKPLIVRIFKFLIVLIFIAVIAVIALAIYVGVNVATTENFNGNEEIQAIVKEDKDLNQVGDAVLYDTFNSLKESDSNEVDIALSQTNMNYLLHAVSKNVKLGQVDIANIYMYYNSDSTYSLYIPMQFMFFKTCVCGNATIDYVSSTNCIDVDIKKISVGKLDTENWIIKTFILPKIDEHTLEEGLKKGGLNAKCDVDKDHVKISIPSDDVIKAVTDKMASANLDMFNVIYSTLINANKLNYEFTNTNIGVKANLDSCVEKSANPNSIESNLSTVKTKMNTLLDNKIVNQSNSTLVFNYLVNGYDMLDDSQKEEIKKIDFSSISLSKEQVLTYKGIIDRTPDTLSAKFNITTEDKHKVLDDRTWTISVSDDEFNNKIQLEKIVGSSACYLNANATDFSYLIVEDIYTEIKEDKVFINILVDINSKETLVSLEFNKVDGNGKLVLSLASAKLSDMNINEDEYLTILKFVSRNVSAGYFTVDPTNNKLVIDFVTIQSEDLNTIVRLLEFVPEYKLVEGAFEITYSTK